MDFQSAMETFAEAWVAANSGKLSLAGMPGGSSSSAATEFVNELPTSTGSSGNHNSSFTSTTTATTPSTATAPPNSQQQLGSKGGGGFPAPASHSLGNNSESGPQPPPPTSAGESQAANAPGQGLSLLYPKSSAGGAGIDLSHPRRLKSAQPPVQRKMSASSTTSSGPSSHKGSGSGLDLGQDHLPHSTIGKSMPIHCIIEVSRDLNEAMAGSGGPIQPQQPADGPDAISAKDGPAEITPKPLAGSNGGRGSVEVDDFVIIPVGTPFHDLVTTVLTLHGYPKDIIRQAEGTISLRNWKPLRLDQVCDSPHKTVGDILNDLTNHATLRVLVTRSKGGSADDLKEKLLRLLLAQSSSLLMGAGGCSLDEVALTSLVKGQWSNSLADDVKRRFDQWYSTQQQQTVSGLVESLQQHHHHQQLLQQQQATLGNGALHPANGNNSLSSPISGGPNVRPSHLLNGSSELRDRVLHHHTHVQQPHLSHHPAHPSLDTLPSTLPHHLHHHSSNGNGAQKSGSFLNDENNELLPHHHLSHHPVFHGLSTQKTRMRTSFDPEMELPKLQQWFADNPHPSRHQIQQYVRDLNLLDCRKDRKPLDVNNVIYWFKNARAAQKRNELRYNGLPAHHGPFTHSLHHGPSQQGQHRDLDRDRSRYPRQSSPENSIHQRRSSSPSPSNHMDFSEDHNNNHDLLFDNNNGDSRHEHSDSSCSGNEDGPDKSSSAEHKVVIKEEHEEDFISVDVEMHEGGPEGQSVANEPRDLSSKSPLDAERNAEERKEVKRDVGMDDEDKVNPHGDNGGESSAASSTSLSPRSSPGLSPNSHFDFSGPPSMINRFHPFFDHPSFMAYRHFNSFNFGQGFPGSGGPAGLEVGGNSSAAVAAAAAAAYEAALGGRKSHPLVGKRSPGSGSSGLDIFHDYPQGARLPSHDSACHPDLARLRGEDLFASRPASSADIISSIINSNRNDLGLGPMGMGGHHMGHGHPSQSALDERRKRNRTFIDPVTEVPRLEQWFGLNTHPSHNLILKYTDELNRMPYRQKFPKLEPKNVQFWFKNRRAKCKRLKMTM